MAASSLYNVSVDLVKAVIAVESEFDQWAVSSKGAQGLMQLMPFTARRFGVIDAFDARQNIFGGVQYLRFLLDLFSGDVSLALAGYNAGENAVARYRGVPPYRETRNYVQKIMGLLSGRHGLPARVLPARRSSPSSPPFPSPRPRPKPVPVRPRIYYKWTDDDGGAPRGPHPARGRRGLHDDPRPRLMRETIPRGPFDQGLFLAHFNKGKELYDTKRLDEAERELEEAYLLRPRDPKVLNLLGLVYFKQEKFEKAEEVYRKLVAESPEAHTLYYNLGLIYFKLNRLEDAESAFLKALELAKDKAKINFYLGSIYERLHRFKDAIYQYRQAGANIMVRRVEDKMAGRPAERADR